MGNLGTGEWIVIGLSLIIGMFFVIGNWINNQRANDAMRWLRRGLSNYGELQSGRFNAPTSKGIPFQIVPAEMCPYQKIRGNLILERRENLPLWFFQLLRGKRDTLTWTSDFQNMPATDIHLIHQSFLPKVNAGKSGNNGPSDKYVAVGTTSYFISGVVSPDLVERISQGIPHLPELILDIAIQHKSPHITFQVHLSPLLLANPEIFFQSLKTWIEMN
jgi:hypothetical protein